MLDPLIDTVLDASIDYHYYILANGKCQYEPGPMTWSAIIQTYDGRTKQLPTNPGTNENDLGEGTRYRAQLYSGLIPLRTLAESIKSSGHDPSNFSVCIMTDSAHLITTLKGRVVPQDDQDLILELMEIQDQFGKHNLDSQWVRSDKVEQILNN